MSKGPFVVMMVVSVLGISTMAVAECLVSTEQERILADARRQARRDNAATARKERVLKLCTEDMRRSMESMAVTHRENRIVTLDGEAFSLLDLDRKALVGAYAATCIVKSEFALLLDGHDGRDLGTWYEEHGFIPD